MYLLLKALKQHFPPDDKLNIHEEQECTDVSKAPIERSNSVSKTNSENTPQQRLKVFKLLLMVKADPFTVHGKTLSTPIHYAARCANAPVLRLLVDQIRLLAKAQSTKGSNGAVDVVDNVVQQAVNQANFDDETPLAWACLGGNVETCKSLLELKVCIESVFLI